ncbi:MAG: J domain-containing protein [Bdellovibrionia bacterium]
MISQILVRWIQSLLQDADPERVRSYAYMIQIGFGGLVISAFYWLKQRETPSGFRVREADLKHDLKKTIGQKPQMLGAAEDPLANARYSKKAEPLRLSGISIQGEPHQILGVRAQATEQEIRAAYRELMKQYHPDRIGRPGSREWQDAQGIAEAINVAKEKMIAALKRK